MIGSVSITCSASDLGQLYDYLKRKDWTLAAVADLFGHTESWASKAKEGSRAIALSPETLSRVVSMAELEAAPRSLWSWFDKAALAGLAREVRCTAWRLERAREQRERIAANKKPHQVLLEQFDDSVEVDWEAQIRTFLRGGQPGPAVIRQGSVARPDAETILERARHQGMRRLLVHAPMGDGVSTVLLQAAEKLLRVGSPPVYYCRGELPEGPLTAPFILMVDDAHEVQTWPDWLIQGLREHDENRLILGTRTYARRLIWDRLGYANLSEVTLTRERAARADLYVDLYRRFGACDEPDNDLLALFADGLGQPAEPSSGGLWCAAYQTTRGATFEDRFEAYLKGLEAARRHAVALLVFANMLTIGSKYNVPFPGQRLMRAFAAAATEEWREHEPTYFQAVQQEVKQLRETLEGELLSQPHVPDPILELRHERLVHVLFRWNFGAGPHRRGDPWLDKYAHYEPMLSAIRQASLPPPAAHAMLFELARVQRRDLRNEREWRRRGSDEALGEITLRLIDKFRQLYRPDAETRGLVDMLEAQVRMEPERRPDQAVRAAAAEQVEAAISACQTSARVLTAAAHFATRHGSLLTSFDPPVWYSLMRMAAALPDLSYTQRAEVDRDFLELFLENRPAGRLDMLRELIGRTGFPDSGIWQPQRLAHLMRLTRLLFEEAERKGFPQAFIGFGAPDERCGDTLRAAYRALWQELARMASKRILTRHLTNESRRAQLQAELSRWAKIERMANHGPVWAPDAQSGWLDVMLAEGGIAGVAGALPASLRA